MQGGKHKGLQALHFSEKFQVRQFIVSRKFQKLQIFQLAQHGKIIDLGAVFDTQSPQRRLNIPQRTDITQSPIVVEIQAL